MNQPYSGLEARLHDVLWAAAGPPSELDLLNSFLSRHRGRALEVGCGSGRLFVPLVGMGHQLEGLDASPEMLDLCRQAAARTGLAPAPVLHLADMREFSADSIYQAVTVPAFTLQLASDPSAMLKRFHHWLTDGGGLYFSAFLPLAELAGDLPENAWYEDHTATLPDGSRAILSTRHRLDRRRHLLHRHHRYHLVRPDGSCAECHESSQTLRWFAAAEWLRRLSRAGFAVTQACGDFDPAVPADEGQIITIEAIKRLDRRRTRSSSPA